MRSPIPVTSPQAPFDTFATALRRRRKVLSMTQKQLADLAGCGLDFIYDLENGKPTLRFNKLLDVLAVLGLGLRLEHSALPIQIDAPLEERGPGERT